MIYISGKAGFQEEVIDRLRDSDLPLMPGNIGITNQLLLFWIDDSVTSRAFKKEIGSRLIFKYRVRFFNSLEAYEKEQMKINSTYTPREEAMIREMNNWQNGKSYLHSA
jgi:hypothetical protein